MRRLGRALWLRIKRFHCCPACGIPMEKRGYGDYAGFYLVWVCWQCEQEKLAAGYDR